MKINKHTFHAHLILKVGMSPGVARALVVVNLLHESLNRSPMSPRTQPCPERNGNNMVRFVRMHALYTLLSKMGENLWVPTTQYQYITSVPSSMGDPYLVPGTRGKDARCNCPFLDNYPPFRASTFPPYVNLDVPYWPHPSLSTLSPYAPLGART